MKSKLFNEVKQMGKCLKEKINSKEGWAWWLMWEAEI
jgi:hypothetical protein